MIIEELKELDLERAKRAIQHQDDFLFMEELIEELIEIQHKYAKPVAALLKGPNG